MSPELEMALQKLGLPTVIVRWTCHYGPAGGEGVSGIPISVISANWNMLASASSPMPNW